MMIIIISSNAGNREEECNSGGEEKVNKKKVITFHCTLQLCAANAKIIKKQIIIVTKKVTNDTHKDEKAQRGKFWKKKKTKEQTMRVTFAGAE